MLLTLYLHPLTPPSLARSLTPLLPACPSKRCHPHTHPYPHLHPPPPPTTPLVPGATICEFISGPVAPAQLSHRIWHAQTVNDNSVGAHHISEFPPSCDCKCTLPHFTDSCCENHRKHPEMICSFTVVDVKIHLSFFCYQF